MCQTELSLFGFDFFGKYLLLKLGVYIYYAKCVGASISVLSVLAYLLYTAFTVFSSIWLSIWSTDTDLEKTDTYLAVYGVLGVLQVIVFKSFSV